MVNFWYDLVNFWYFGSMNEQPHMQSPFFGAGMQLPIQPNIPYVGGILATLLLYQQFGTVSPHYNSNQIIGQPKMPNQSVHNEEIQNEGVGRDRQTPAPDSETASINNKIYLQPDGDT